MSQPQLFPNQRRKRRVMMHAIDAGPGNPNWVEFECQKCAHKENDGNVSELEFRRGRPCPKCNQEFSNVIPVGNPPTGQALEEQDRREPRRCAAPVIPMTIDEFKAQAESELKGKKTQ